MNPNQREIEASLAVCAADAGAVADAIAALRQIDGYVLVRPVELMLQDVYWDMPNDSLGRERMALRLRTAGGETLLTLKGPPTRDSDGLSSRLEIEAPWSAAALRQVLDTLDDAGVFTTPATLDTGKNTPQASLEALGFVIVQERETRRRTRDLVPSETPDAPALAELAIDRTTYRFDGRALVHNEIEIEVKAPGGGPTIARAMAALRKQYGPALRPWTYGKLATGETIGKLLKRGDLDGTIAPDGALLPAAYDRLEADFTGKDTAVAR